MKYILAAWLWFPLNVSAQTKTLQIKGLVETPLTLDVAQLRALPVQEGRDFKIVSSSGEVRYTLETYRGVRLADVLKKAVVKLSNQKEKGKYFIVASATDGYTAIFSHNDLFNNPTGEGVLILFEENGQPITTNGAFVLISTTDKISGARHVKWLNSVEVRKVE